MNPPKPSASANCFIKSSPLQRWIVMHPYNGTSRCKNEFASHIMISVLYLLLLEKSNRRTSPFLWVTTMSMFVSKGTEKIRKTHSSPLVVVMLKRQDYSGSPVPSHSWCKTRQEQVLLSYQKVKLKEKDNYLFLVPLCGNYPSFTHVSKKVYSAHHHDVNFPWESSPSGGKAQGV